MGIAGALPWGATGLVLLALAAASAAGADPVVTTGPTGIRVERTQLDVRLSGWILAEGPASLSDDSLVRALGVDGEIQTLRSTDDGQTWTVADRFPASEPVDAGRSAQWSIASFYLDPVNGKLVRFLYRVLTKIGETGFAYGDAAGYGPRTYRLYYQVSPDGGLNWGPRRQIIEQGAEYDADHWCREVWFGRSGAVTEGRTPTRLADGTIVLPCGLWPSDEFLRTVFDEQRWPAELRGYGAYYIEGFVLKGKWRADDGGLDWVSGATIRLPGGYTAAGQCGSDEPALAFLDDGRWFATVRTSGAQDDMPRLRMPILPWTAVSTDQGATWGEVRPLRFDDGSPAYVPSAYPEMVRSAKTGRWYWIGNLLPQPTYGQCDPRYPLCLAELDPQTLRLKRDTVTVIQDREPDDALLARYSNFRVYEQRRTGDLILLMTRGYSEMQEGEGGLPRPTFRYRIVFPD
jgi:hypothetical protein